MINKKNIWIDGYEANVPQRLGSGQVAYELIKNIEKFDQINSYTVVLPTPPLKDMPKEREGFRYKILKPRRLWTRIALPIALFTSKNKPDVLFSPTHYGPRFTRVKNVVTIFDIAYFQYPQMFLKKDLYKLKKWGRYSVDHAKHIITISNFSKKEIIKYYHINKDKITVAYPGYGSKIFYPIKDQAEIIKIKEEYKIEGDYVLFLGTVQPRKNLLRLIEAFKNIDNIKLVVVGKTSGVGRQGWMFEEILNKPKELGIEEQIIFTGFVPDKQVPFLMNGAQAFILPSLYEGFGIPVVDAMACGIPVIVSNVSSLPEIVGQAGLKVDPLSVSQIEIAIRTITTDTKLHVKLSKAGLKQSQNFSWEKMTRKVIKVLENV